MRAAIFRNAGIASLFPAYAATSRLARGADDGTAGRTEKTRMGKKSKVSNVPPTQPSPSKEAEADRMQESTDLKDDQRRKHLFDVVFNPPKEKIVRVLAFDEEDAHDMALSIFEFTVSAKNPDRKKRTVYECRRGEGVVPVTAERRQKK